MTTKTYKGQTYEIGKFYEFSNDEDFSKTHTIKSMLKDVDSEPYPFRVCVGDYAFCREMSPDLLGRITKAKIEPDIGKYYKVSLGNTIIVIQWNESLTMDSGLEIICEMVEKTEGEITWHNAESTK